MTQYVLPDLPYDYSALEPHMSARIMELHHDKHHKAYVDNGNKLLEGSGLEGKSIEDIVKGAFGKNLGARNGLTGQVLGHGHDQSARRPDLRFDLSHCDMQCQHPHPS